MRVAKPGFTGHNDAGQLGTSRYGELSEQGSGKVRPACLGRGTTRLRAPTNGAPEVTLVTPHKNLTQNICAKAREQRSRGNFELAEVAERNADSIYSRCIKPENRW